MCTCLSVSVTVCSSVVCGFCFCVYACMCLSSPSSSILISPFNYLSASTSVFFCIVVFIPKQRRKSFAVYLRLLPLTKTKHRKLNQNQFVYAKPKNKLKIKCIHTYWNNNKHNISVMIVPCETTVSNAALKKIK